MPRRGTATAATSYVFHVNDCVALQLTLLFVQRSDVSSVLSSKLHYDSMSVCHLLLAATLKFLAIDSVVLVFANGAKVSYTPVFHPITKSALCSIDPPSAVLLPADVSNSILLPPGIPEPVLCSYGCTGYSGCTSFNYRLPQSASAQCELYTYTLKNCTTSTNDTCFHYQMIQLQPPSCRIYGGWSNWTKTSTCTIGKKTFTQIRYCNYPAPTDAGAQCVKTTGGSASIEYNYTACGGWSSWTKISNCTIGQTTFTRVRNCNNPAPSDGSTCFTLNGGPALVEYNYVACGGWSTWTHNTTCTAVGQRTSTMVRYCNNPAPSDGSQCFNSTGGSALVEYNQTACGGWSDWTQLTNCTAVGQKTWTRARYCNNPAPSDAADAGSQCINSTGRPALIEYSYNTCDACDPNCGVTCTINGYLTCDGACTIGYGLNTTSYTCQACDAHCSCGSCNSYGPGTCDGPCALGYVLNETSHFCVEFPHKVIDAFVDCSSRDLWLHYWDYVNLTLAICAQHCSDQGFKFAGAQYGQQCFCGNSYGMFGKTTATKPCGGDSSEICGDGWVNTVMSFCDRSCGSVFCNVSAITPCNGKCTVGYGIDSTTNTCKACNTPYCSSSCNNYGPGTCDGPCVAGYTLHPTQHICIQFRYAVVDCYSDNSTVRDLSGNNFYCSRMTLSHCALYCYNLNYLYAAAQSGSYCFCGDSYGQYGTATNCDAPCSGDNGQICGGSLANTVLSYACDPNCASSRDCIVSGVGKCDTQCKTDRQLSTTNTCIKNEPQPFGR